jgi:oxygen-independent coproporphyrinogen-3 oxidase
LVYWRYGDYVGVGPGAHGRIGLGDGTRVATVALSDPAAWMGQVTREGNGIETQTALASLEQAEEILLMGLRLAEGVSLARLRALTGHEIGESALAELSALDMVAVADDRVWLTPDGRLLLNQATLKLAGALQPTARDTTQAALG